jgi:hypothetical protein
VKRDDSEGRGRSDDGFWKTETVEICLRVEKFVTLFHFSW